MTRRVERGTDRSAAFRKDLARCQNLAWWLDARFGVGRIRFGLDSVVGLIPGIGDGITAVVGGYMAYVAWKHGMGRWVIFRIVLNLVLDGLIGTFPAAGDVVDVLFKAHLRNVRILERRGWEMGLIVSEEVLKRAQERTDWEAVYGHRVG